VIYLFDRDNKNVFQVKIKSMTDWITFSQIFIQRDYDLIRFSRFNNILEQYEKILNEGGTPLIIDCGGNIGFSILYFNLLFKKSKIIYVEPDLKNYSIGLENIKFENVQLINAAVGPRSGWCDILDEGYGSNGLQIERADNGAIKVLTITEIINGQKAVPFIIKIDIEGYEEELFSENIEWVDKFPLLIIELHDNYRPSKAVSRNFLNVISKYDRDFLYHNENVFSISNKITCAE